MKVYKGKDYAAVSEIVADLVAVQIKSKPDAVLGLATGSTPEGAYEELTKKYENKEIDFSKIKTVNLDEYVGLSGDNDQSYRYYMNHHLFDRVNIDKNNTNLPDGLELDGRLACKKYDEILSEMGAPDVQLLGLGNNGHIGFNEPADEFSKGTQCVDLTESTIKANARFFASLDEVPKKAYTMGIESIMNAKQIILIVTGEGKRDILRSVFFSDVTPQVPASILQKHPNVILVADEAALGDNFKECC